MRALAVVATAAAVQRTTIRGHAVRRVDGVNGLYVYSVAYGGGSDGAKHDALATQLWPSARIAADLVADLAPASRIFSASCVASPNVGSPPSPPAPRASPAARVGRGRAEHAQPSA